MRDCEVSYRQNDAPPIPLEDNALSLQSLTDPVLPIGRKASLPLIKDRPLDGVDISLIKTCASVNAHTWEPRDISIVFGK